MSGVLSSAVPITFVLVLASLARAQTQNNEATTDPSEASALNSVFGQWNITARWNTTEDPCSGAAIDPTVAIVNVVYNPFIKCDCSFNSRSLCHITHLRAAIMDITGPIPEELWTLTFLVHLYLHQNYLTGSISPSVGNLTRIQVLALHANALSGEIPKELGQLTELIYLAFSANNFSGPLPSELGNLLKLQFLYIDSSGVSGEIPSTFGNLQNLQIVVMSDNELTGRIPDFIGNWSQLKQLRIQGNSFEGPIPSSFTSLTSLEDLRLSDISNMTSSLDFIKDMKSLSILVLRNNNIFDSIPLNIGEYQNLQNLDLSFNKLHGHIPDSLFNLASLSSLFLGNNSLDGTLPLQKSKSLLIVDVSYNNLVGNIPSWVNGTAQQFNLVGNNFLIESSDNRVLLSGLTCLQKTFPCNRGSPLHSEFAIDCGGHGLMSFDGNTEYEADTATLGPASYAVTSTNRWAVSNVGLFADSSIANYTSSSLSLFTNTLNSKLFQTTRLSASSLRYYGLGLENGNYTVQLQFGEIAFESGRTWKSIGRRVFDIYIQGKIVLKDFDIRKEAGGASLRAVSKPFTAQVSENYLEIHLFWAGKGTCCIPAFGTYGPSISAISATPDFMPTVSNKRPSTKKNRIDLIVGIVVGVLAFVSVLVVFFIVRRKRKSQMYDEEFLGMDVRPFTFSYAELKTATNDFDSASKLGEGGFGSVYKGTLEDGRVIAVKQLSLTSHQGNNQFVTEITTISAVQHRNLVKLYGCCFEGDKRLLVYEFLENKSLDQALLGKHKLQLNWPTRFEICLGVAKGLAYLHEESRLCIVHRDVKSSNILLDSNFVPKISDFGLAKLYDDTKTHISTRVAGTIGYLAPEYAMRGHLTEKTDVFAFGVVALEVIGGRRNSDSTLDEDKIYLLEWAWNLHEQSREIELVDPDLYEFDEEEVRRIIGVALLCTQTLPAVRPSMSRVVAMLLGDTDTSTEISRPGYLADWKYNDVSSLMTNVATKGTDSSFYDYSASMVAEMTQH